MNYTVDYFIAKFEAIPDEQWCVGEFTDQERRHCAVGHCLDRMQLTEESKALVRLMGHNTTFVNDGVDPDYQQPTPKARILAALRDIKAKQEITA